MAYDVFISYRRDGAAELAQLLFTCLKADGYNPFFDVEKMRSGKFNTQLYDVIDECKDMILLLPENALKPRESEDWVRLEIAHAIKSKLNIVPILMRGFSWPKELPDDINEVRYCHGISADMEYFDAVYEKLKSLLHSSASSNNAKLSDDESEKNKSQLHLADFYLSNHEFDEANDLFNKILSVEPECGKAYLGRFMAKHCISTEFEFQEFYSKNIVYNDIDLKCSKEYADSELKGIFDSLVLPRCTFHHEIATMYCDCCNGLMCDKCATEIESEHEHEYGNPPIFHKKRLCHNCMDLFRGHINDIYRKNRWRCIIDVAVVLLIITVSVCFSSYDIKGFFTLMGVITGSVFLIKKGLLGELLNTVWFDGLMGIIIGLLLSVCVSTVFAPILLLWVLVTRIYWLIVMRIKTASLKKPFQPNIDQNRMTIDAYYKMLDITKYLGRDEPSLEK